MPAPGSGTGSTYFASLPPVRGARDRESQRPGAASAAPAPSPYCRKRRRGIGFIPSPSVRAAEHCSRGRAALRRRHFDDVHRGAVITRGTHRRVPHRYSRLIRYRDRQLAHIRAPCVSFAHSGCVVDLRVDVCVAWERVPGTVYVIEYDDTFTFPVSVAALWQTLVQVDCYLSWWSWLHEFSVEGIGLQHGTVLHGIVAPPLPYRMELEVCSTNACPNGASPRVHGDSGCPARLTFDGNDAEAQARAVWTVEMMQRPMRLAARFAHPLLRWGHDRVVEATVDGFRRHLGDDVAH